MKKLSTLVIPRDQQTYHELTSSGQGAIGWAGLLLPLVALLSIAFLARCDDGPDPRTAASAGTYQANQGGYRR